VHNTKELRCRRSLENFDQIITLLAGMADRFATALDCADTGFLPDGILDHLALPAQAGPRRTAGVDLNKPRIRAALSAALALAPAPGGFTAAEHAAKVRQITRQDGYTTRQAAYDLRKLRGKQLIDKPGRTDGLHRRGCKKLNRESSRNKPHVRSSLASTRTRGVYGLFLCEP